MKSSKNVKTSSSESGVRCPSDIQTMTLFYLVHVLKALHEVLRYIIVSLFRPVSYPGDPIAKPLTRRGKWTQAPVAASSGWKFASAEESHAVSGKMYPGVAITGPPAGRQMWYKDDDLRPKSPTVSGPQFNAAGNPNSGDKLFRSIMISRWKGPVPDTKATPKTAREAAKKALSFYQMLQCDDGHWAGDYGGPMFLMPGLITCLYITKAPFPQWKKDGMITYLKNHQQDDGGWGTHIECARYVFVRCLLARNVAVMTLFCVFSLCTHTTYTAQCLEPCSVTCPFVSSENQPRHRTCLPLAGSS